MEIVPVQFYNREATIVDLQTTSARLHVTTCHVSGSEGTSTRADLADALVDPTAFDSLSEMVESNGLIWMCIAWWCDWL